MADKVEFRWFGKQVSNRISFIMSQRVMRAAAQFRRKVVKNISIPVVYTGDGIIRSKPFEFPRTETARLRKDIFWKTVGPHEAVIGTTLDYGAILEFKMSRSFLRRTLREEQGEIMLRLVLGPPRMPGRKGLS